MTKCKTNPVARAGADRAPKTFICLAAMNDSEHKLSALEIQLDFLARCGVWLTPAELIGTLCFEEGRR